MATIVEQQPTQPPLGIHAYDQMRMNAPQFTNPWAAQPGAGSPPQQMYQAPYQHPAPQQQQFNPLPAGEPQRSYPDYSAPPISQSSYAPTSAPTSMPAAMPRFGDSYGPNPSSFAFAPRPDMKPGMSRDAYEDQLDASRGMLAMSQNDITPRNIYGSRNGSTDSYGFPITSSAHSSISSGSYPSYYGSYAGSVDGSVAGSSVTDYSSASEEPMQSRTLPPPSSIIGGFPPEPSSMMTQFNSKLSGTQQKKHKCKICEKRFTRPSSLQTHMYSHTGEKPFACDFEGCGRHFSVVSNLRRHKKCHRGGSTRTSPSVGESEE